MPSKTPTRQISVIDMSHNAYTGNICDELAAALRERGCSQTILFTESSELLIYQMSEDMEQISTHHLTLLNIAHCNI